MLPGLGKKADVWELEALGGEEEEWRRQGIGQWSGEGVLHGGK